MNTYEVVLLSRPEVPTVTVQADRFAIVGNDDPAWCISNMGCYAVEFYVGGPFLAQKVAVFTLRLGDYVRLVKEETDAG